MFRKNFFLCVLSVLCFFTLCMSLRVTADSADGHLVVDTVSASAGESVVIPVRIEDNPGIMAITVSITYDQKELEYEDFYRGYLTDYTVVDHPDRGIIRFVNCESGDRNDNDVMIALQFRVKETASGGLHEVSISYEYGDFCNWSLKKLMPEITPGGVEIAYTEDNCSHDSYGEWEITAEPTCTKPGTRQRRCLHCSHVQTEEIKAIAHTWDNGKVTKAATYDATGVKTYTCKECGKTKTETIAKLKKTGLAKATVSGIKDQTYTGKALTQKITVKLGSATLKNGTDYKVTYENNKNVGTATVIVTGLKKYSGTIKKTFKINPKATALSKVTAGKKAFTAAWKKQAAQTTGYEIQYSTDKNFKKSNKTVKTSKNGTVTSTVKSLTAKKTYYVRVRTYKTVGKTTYYSSYSSALKVTTKK